jgi:acyl carrier protein
MEPSETNMTESERLNAIASEMYNPEQILSMIRAKKNAHLEQKPIFEAPHTPIEKGMAEIWAEFLDIDLERLGIHDNFFDLGGHSLLAVQILSRAREVFQIELPLEVVFSSDLTIATIARAIEQYQIEQADIKEIDAILEELEKLSDDEVRALLVREEERDAPI